MGFIYQYVLHLRLKLREIDYTSTTSEKDKEYLSIVIKIVLTSGTPGHTSRTATLATLNTPRPISPLFLVWPFLLSGKFFPYL